MAKGKRILRNKRKGGRLLAAAVLVLAVMLMLQPASPASAVPVSPAEADTAPWTAPEEPAAPEAEAVPEPEEALEDEAAPKAPAEPTEEPAEPETPAELVVKTVPESEPAEEGYFADTVFLGDSRTEGFHLYSGLEEGQYLYAVGATVESVFTKSTQETEAGTVPILDALAEMDCGKVYIMLGVNELGWPRAEVFREQYGHDPKIEAIHAGVECGILAGKLPGLDVVSIGPDLTEIHTPRERMHIASVQRTWALVTELLKRSR